MVENAIKAFAHDSNHTAVPMNISLLRARRVTARPTYHPEERREKRENRMSSIILRWIGGGLHHARTTPVLCLRQPE